MTGGISVCLLASGFLGLACPEHIFAKQEVCIHSVFTDKRSDGILEFCSKNGIPCFAGNPRNGATADFRNNLQERPCVVLSVNYLFLIEEDAVRKYIPNQESEDMRLDPNPGLFPEL